MSLSSLTSTFSSSGTQRVIRETLETFDQRDVFPTNFNFFKLFFSNFLSYILKLFSMFLSSSFLQQSDFGDLIPSGVRTFDIRVMSREKDKKRVPYLNVRAVLHSCNAFSFNWEMTASGAQLIGWFYFVEQNEVKSIVCKSFW